MSNSAFHVNRVLPVNVKLKAWQSFDSIVMIFIDDLLLLCKENVKISFMLFTTFNTFKSSIF